jgi:hypothetical protein
MNERIKELFRQAWKPSTAICPASNQPYESKYFSEDLFAELIIQECISQIEVCNCHSGDMWDEALSAAGDTIKEHFGVE